VDDVKEWKTAVEDLQARLREEIELRTELERRCHLLEKLAHRDPTTGLKTESYLRVRVQEEIDRAIRHPASASLLTLCAPGNRYEAIP
jgi:GGDEF domain-containing protein